MYDRALPPQGLVEFARAGQAAWFGCKPEQMFSASGLQGTAAQAAARVRELWAAGADSVVLRPFGQDPVGQVTATIAELRRGQARASDCRSRQLRRRN